MRDSLADAQPRIAWAVLLIYVGLIFYASSRSYVPSPQQIPHWDKVAHLIEYGILGFLSQRAARLTWPRPERSSILRRGLLTLGAGICIAAADELFQSWVPNREPSVADLAADAGGLAIGFLLNRPLRPDKATSAGERE